MIHSCFVHPRFDHPRFSPWIVHHFGLSIKSVCHPCLITTFFTHFDHLWVYVARWCRTVFPPGGPCQAKCWFEFLKKCLMRELNPRSPVCHAPMLIIRPWMVSWVGLILACRAAATCVWLAYGLCPSHFDCLSQKWSNSHA